MKKYYLAIDIGASGGRHILGYIDNNILRIEEIYRFENNPVEKNNHLIWDIKYLFDEVVKGIKKCKEIDKIPVSLSIDTWAVDYALLDSNNDLIGEVYCYRDSRTSLSITKVHEIISQKELYDKTGIQFQPFNTIYQLYEDKLNGRIKKAESFLMLPDYLHFLLTGNKVNEYTNATSTGMVNSVSHKWDEEIIKKLGLPKHLFIELTQPGISVGSLKKEIADNVGFNCEISLIATHDTASSILAKVGEEDSLYISSGTWSLLGVEVDNALKDEKSRTDNYSNEGNLNYKFRYQKNIMGLWIIQCIRHELNDELSFDQIVAHARSCCNFPCIIDVNDNRFLAPKSMIKEITSYCIEKGIIKPENVGEILYCVYRSLAHSYKIAIEQLEGNTNKKYKSINIMGGGSKNEFLNKLTSEVTGKKVIAGPDESTAIGNIITQMIFNNTIKDFNEAKRIIRNSFEIKTYGGNKDD